MRWFKTKWYELFVFRSLLNAISDVWNSFKDNKEGLGARRLTTFGFMFLVVFLHYKYSAENVIYFFIGDCLMVLILLSILTIQQVIELYKIYSNKDKETTLEEQKMENKE